MIDLWDVPAAGVDFAEIPPGQFGPDAFVPRPYQLEDISASLVAWKAGSRAVLYRAATGTGKATVLATLATTHRASERSLCLVNTIKLAKQLRETFARQLGWQPGLVGGGVFDGADRRVVIAVVQSLYSQGRDGITRVERTFDPTDFGLLLVDECEGALADKYAGVVRHFLNGNPELHCLGCTATPIRGDGVGMGALFDHIQESEDRPLNRGPLWAFGQGWLVPPLQRFVQCSADFSTVKIRKKPGEDVADYSDEQLGKMLADDKHLIEMAQGVVRAAGTERAIVVCPNSTDLCDRIADFINGQKPGSARAAHGNTLTCPDAEAAMKAHQRGAFQFLCGVNMLTTGYDDPDVRSVFILRPTKSQRLFTQIIGRAFRPHGSIARALGEAADAPARKSLIASSPKPQCFVYCLVGVSRDTRDMTIADLVRGRLTDEELERVKQKMLDGVVAPDAGEAKERSVAEVVAEVRKEIVEEKAAKARRQLEIDQATVSIRDMDDGKTPNAPKQLTGAYELLRRMGYRDAELDRIGEGEARRLSQFEIARAKSKPPLSSKGQRRVLEGRGLSSSEAEAMSKGDATRAIDAISKAERWGGSERGARLSASRVRELVAGAHVQQQGAA